MLLNPDTGKMIISRDVTFDEQGVWDLTKKVTDSTPKNPPMPFYLDEGNSSNQPVKQSDNILVILHLLGCSQMLCSHLIIHNENVAC